MTHPGGQPRHDRQRPQLLDAARAVEDEQQQERDEGAEHPGQVPHGGGHAHRLLAAELAGGRGGDGHGAEAHVDGVTDHDDDGRLELGQAQGRHHGGGDRHRGAEAGQPLEQAAEGEGHDEGLGAHVALADHVEHGLEVLGATRDVSEVVEPHGRDDDVDDRDESQRHALGGAHDRHAHRHVEQGDRGDGRDHQGDDGAPVGGHLEHAHEDEEHHQRQQTHRGGEVDVAAHGGGRRREGGGQSRQGWDERCRMHRQG